MPFRIGCQSITFGTELHQTNIEAVLSSVAAAGYDGVEMGFYRLDPARSAVYRELLAKHKIDIVALHVGGNIYEPKSQEEQLTQIATVCRLVRELGGKNVFLSGINRKEAASRDSYVADAKKIDELGARIAEEGLTLCYHNHDWEIHNDLQGLNILADYTRPANMSFVLDVGWVTRGGADPVAVIRSLGDRVRHLHFKEFTAEGGFTEIGRGIVRFADVAAAVRGRSMWVVAEQDQSAIGADESVRHNCAAIRSLLKGA